MKLAGSVPAYFAHVDGLRAVAVLAVMLYHLYPPLLPGGFVGVDVFFVISGFVVTASLAGHSDERLAGFLGQFYARRLARLAPALVLMLVITTALYVLFVPRTWFNRAAETTGQAAFWGLSNWVLERQAVNYFEPRAEFNPFVHTWSLGVEEQFYLLAPLFLFAALGLHHGLRTKRLGIGAVALAAVLSFLACYGFGVALGARAVFYGIVFRFWELAAGVLLCLFNLRLAGLTARQQWLHRHAGGAGLLLVLLAMVLPHPQAYPWVRATIAVIGTVLLIGLPHAPGATGAASMGRVRRWLAHPAAVWTGQRSYSLYLWHWPVYVLARWTVGLTVWPFNLLAVVTTFAAALVSYRFVEAPVRQSIAVKRLPLRARLGVFLLLLAAGWGAGQALLTAQPTLGLGQPTRQAADWYPDRGLLKTTLAASRRCEPVRSSGALGTVTQGTIEFTHEGCPTPPVARLFVIGDSHATAYLPMLEQLSAEQGRTVTVMQAPGCSYLDLMEPLSPATDAHCHGLARAAMAKVLARAQPGDIVFLPSLRLPRLVLLGGEKRNTGGDVYARTPRELLGIRAAAADAPAWTQPFIAAGLHVLIEAPKPVLRSHPFACVDAFNRGNPDCADGLSELRADQQRYRAPVLETLAALASRSPGISVWDPTESLCSDSRCEALQNDRPLFFDGDHVSPYGNLVLLPSFKRTLDSLPAR